VAIRRSSAPQTSALIKDLAGADPVQREAAVARLAIAGSRAVEPLLQALPQASVATQTAILRALELIASPRAVQPAITSLSSPDAAVVIAAIGAMRPHLGSPDESVAAMALDALTAKALDRTAADAVRVAALGALADAGDPVLTALRNGLQSEPRARVRRAAGLDGPVETEIELAAARLEAAIETGENDPELLHRLLVEAGSSIALSMLHELVLFLRGRERAERDGSVQAAWQAARGAAHLALARRESRLALFDLREALSQVSATRLEPFVKAVEAIGDASCLDALVTAWERTAADGRAPIAQAFKVIVVRERLTRRHATVKRAIGRAPGLAAFLS
jgi:hypothetical protein